MSPDQALDLLKISDKHRSQLRRLLSRNGADDIDSAFRTRLPPVAIRGAGLIAICSSGDIVVCDVGPHGDRVERIPAGHLGHASSRPNSSVAKISELTLTRIDGVSFKFELVGDHLELFEGLSAGVPIVDLVANWWDRPDARLPSRMRLDYIGGWPEQVKQREDVEVSFSPAGVQASVALQAWKILIPWASVRDVQVEGSDTVNSRVTVSRLLLVGWFAFAWKKKQWSSFLVVDLGDAEVIFASKKMTVQQLRVQCTSVLHQYSPSKVESESVPPATKTIADQIRDLARLRDDGLVSELEFQQKRTQLLDRM